MRWSIPSLVLSICATSASAWAQADDRDAMRGWINAARAAEGLHALAGDPRLDAVADAHARDMATNRFFSHASPSTGGPGDRASAAGIAFRGLAENIAMNQSARAAHEALLRSPGHRANLLSPTLRRVGLGFARGPDGLYVTQLFATLPDDAATPPPAATRAPTPPIAQDPAEAAPSAATPDTLPQALNALPSLLDPRRWGSVLPNASPAPRAPARTSARAARTLDIPTPFGAVRVRLPAQLEAPRVTPEPAAWDDADTGCDGVR